MIEKTSNLVSASVMALYGILLFKTMFPERYAEVKRFLAMLRDLAVAAWSYATWADDWNWKWENVADAGQSDC